MVSQQNSLLQIIRAWSNSARDIPCWINLCLERVADLYGLLCVISQGISTSDHSTGDRLATTVNMTRPGYGTCVRSHVKKGRQTKIFLVC